MDFLALYETGAPDKSFFPHVPGNFIALFGVPLQELHQVDGALHRIAEFRMFGKNLQGGQNNLFGSEIRRQLLRVQPSEVVVTSAIEGENAFVKVGMVRRNSQLPWPPDSLPRRAHRERHHRLSKRRGDPDLLVRG